jgi:hypothetical protein
MIVADQHSEGLANPAPVSSERLIDAVFFCRRAIAECVQTACESQLAFHCALAAPGVRAAPSPEPLLGSRSSDEKSERDDS